MNRKIILVSHSHLTSLDLEAFVRQAQALKQQNRKCFTTPFPSMPAASSPTISSSRLPSPLPTRALSKAVSVGWRLPGFQFRPRPVCGLLWH